jgi:DNA-binding NarL/FixJ family response regulator
MKDTDMAGRKSSEKGGKSRVLIVDDHPIVRDGLKDLIEQEPDLSVCGTAQNVPEALKALDALKPDAAIVDISLNKDMGGLELIKDIKVRCPNLPVLVLSMHDETLFAERALRAGALGYVMKEQATEKVLTALRKILKGEIYLNERVAAKMLSRMIDRKPMKEDLPSIEQLSDRELEVFEMIGQGIGTRTIAEKLHLSVKTVEAHRMHIREKLKLRDGAELLQHAIQWVQSEKMQ